MRVYGQKICGHTIADLQNWNSALPRLLERSYFIISKQPCWPLIKELPGNLGGQGSILKENFTFRRSGNKVPRLLLSAIPQSKKSCEFAVAEVLPSSCGVVVAEKNYSHVPSSGAIFRLLFCILTLKNTPTSSCGKSYIYFT